MRAPGRWLSGTLMLAAAGLLPGAGAAEEPARATPHPAGSAVEGRLDLSIRALGSGPESLSRSAPVEIERIRPTLGAGSSRWPSATTEVAPRVHVTVMPACIPGLDEPPPLPGRRTRAPRR